MFLTIGDTEYTLQTTLGTAESIEIKFQKPLMDVLIGIESAVIKELVTIIAIAAGKIGDSKLNEDIKAHMDYIELQSAVMELLARMMFSGTAEQVEKKLDKFAGGEQAKNVLRGLLGLPMPEPVTPSTGNA